MNPEIVTEFTVIKMGCAPRYVVVTFGTVVKGLTKVTAKDPVTPIVLDPACTDADEEADENMTALLFVNSDAFDKFKFA